MSVNQMPSVDRNLAPAGVQDAPRGEQRQLLASQGVARSPDSISSQESGFESLWNCLAECFAPLIDVLRALWRCLTGGGEEEHDGWAGPIYIPREAARPQQAADVQNINAAQAYVNPFNSFHENIKEWFNECNNAHFSAMQLPYEVRTIVRIYDKTTNKLVHSHGFTRPNQKKLLSFDDLESQFSTIYLGLQSKEIHLDPMNTKIGIIYFAVQNGLNNTYNVLSAIKTFQKNGMETSIAGPLESGKSEKGVEDIIRNALQLLDNKPQGQA